MDDAWLSDAPVEAFEWSPTGAELCVRSSDGFRVITLGERPLETVREALGHGRLLAVGPHRGDWWTLRREDAGLVLRPALGAPAVRLPWTGSLEVDRAALSPDGRWMAGAIGPRLVVWPVQTAREPLEVSLAPDAPLEPELDAPLGVGCFAWSGNSRYLALQANNVLVQGVLVLDVVARRAVMTVG
jgi:hypothetical protein